MQRKCISESRDEMAVLHEGHMARDRNVATMNFDLYVNTWSVPHMWLARTADYEN